MIFALIYIVISIVNILYPNIFTNEDSIFQTKTGKYYAKSSHIGNGSKVDVSWDISISDKDTRKNVIENSNNSELLHNFKTVIIDIKKTKANAISSSILVILLICHSAYFFADKSIKFNKFMKLLVILPLLILSFVIINMEQESLGNLKNYEKSVEYTYSLIQ